MSPYAPVPAPRAEGSLLSPWTHVARVAAALAAGMGVGRFVYTSILPLMHAQAGSPRTPAPTWPPPTTSATSSALSPAPCSPPWSAPVRPCAVRSSC